MPDRVPDFRELARALASEPGQQSLLPVIEKELLHYGILNAMDEAGHLERLTFQGGTCLRLCYGAERFSEDLDFCGGPGFSASDFDDLAWTLVQALTSRYGLEVEVSSPGPRTPTGPVSVETWWVKVTTAPARPDLPKQRVSIQVANVSAHTREVQALRVRHSGLPTSYAGLLIVCESVEEICADKLKAFATSRFVRHRDLWDMRWLSLQPGFDQSQLQGLLGRKINDYQAQSEFAAGLDRVSQVGRIVEDPAFLTQLARFLPASAAARTILRPTFRSHVAQTVTALYRAAGVEV
ncbi:MAG: nucleotidyl transferase AbiEii/AbiGii toxin family protein [Propionibacteriaceae bacterium]|jgi:hypothetical protein|nr:nucleotidyl transferase AbiEii/AbiGii toxin family protein [Propionibacteriaceae bacterium]